MIPRTRGFASDNNSGIHPDILEAIVRANGGHFVAYGDDPFTARAVREFRRHFGKQAEVFLVFTGTGANTLSVRAAAQSYQSVVCATSSHLSVDECGAPENFTGCKVITVASTDGKIDPSRVAPYLHYAGNQHHVQPRMISITQPTELGTVYRLEEIEALAEFAHENDMLLHMDGARLCNAAASLHCTLGATSGDAGVDVLSFGGTKNGMMVGEAVVLFRTDLAADFAYIRKQGMHLASKMRFLSAQFIAFFDEELWLRNATHANKMAGYLARRLSEMPDCRIVQEVEANAVFARIPPEIVEDLQSRYFFYLWDSDQTIARFMTSFDTEREDIDGFVSALRELIDAASSSAKDT
jgi:threonine aldolase